MKKWAGLLAVVLTVVLVVVWHNRIGPDFYPLDSSRVGPNLVASVVQWIIVALVAYLVYPPLRKRIDAWVGSHFRQAHAEVHDKLDRAIKLSEHVIRHHPDIPNEDRHGNLLIHPPEEE